MPEPHLRAADADRNAVADSLGRHMAAGRLTVAEYDDRLARVYAARTYGELAALAGRPRAARAAGTFCARCELAPFLPVHRVVSSTGIGSWGSDGVEYKRRMLELEGVSL